MPHNGLRSSLVSSVPSLYINLTLAPTFQPFASAPVSFSFLIAPSGSLQGGNGGQRSWEALARDTTTAIETVKSHSELVNELLLAEGAGEFEMGITMEVMSEMMTFSQAS